MSGVWVGLAISAVGVGLSYEQGKEATASQQAAQESQRRAASVESARSRMSQIREARLREARVRAQAGAGGMGQASSGVAGSIASIGSQLGANIGAINVQEGFAEAASASMQSAANAQVKQAQWQAVGQTGQSIFTQRGGWTSIFGGNTSKPAGS